MKGAPLRSNLRAFEKADPAKAVYQLLTTFLALVLAWGATYVALAVHPLLAVLPGLTAVGLLVRMFIMAPLWDEEGKRLVSFRAASRLPAGQEKGAPGGAPCVASVRID